MSEIVDAIKALYDQHNEKVEKLKTVVGLGVTQEDLEKYEKQSLESCHAASAKLLKNDLIATFGPDGVVEDVSSGNDDSNAALNRAKRMAGIPLPTTSSSQPTPVRSTKRSAIRKSDNVELNYKCQECGKLFVNAGNLKNHQYAHDREVRIRQSVANVSAAEFMEMIAVANKDVAAAIKQIIGTDNNTVGEAFPQQETAAAKRRRERLDTDLSAPDEELGGEFKKKKSVGGAATRKAYTLQEKLLVLEKHDELIARNEMKDLQYNVGRFFNISQSLVSKWLKQRQVIEENAKESSGKRLKYHYRQAHASAAASSSSSSSYGHGGAGGAAAAPRGSASPQSVSSSDSIEQLIPGGGGVGSSSSSSLLYPGGAAAASATAAETVVMVPKKKGRSTGAAV